MKIAVLSLATLLFLAGCDRVETRPKPEAASPPGDAAGKPGASEGLVYKLDAAGGLFKQLKWYQYDMWAGHIIWSLNDVFAFKTERATYLAQIQTYYAEGPTKPGMYKLAVRAEGTPQKDFVLDGQGCGNPWTNLGFEACTKDPEQNVFAYLDFDSGRVAKMTDAAAALDPEWDIAVRGTDIKLNAGPGFVGHTAGALARRFPEFFDAAGSADTGKLRDAGLKEKVFAAFAAEPFRRHYDYALPEGIDRVLHESYWYRVDKGVRQATADKFWILRGKDGASFTKVEIPAITDTPGSAPNSFESAVRFEYVHQAAGAANFETAARAIEIRLSTEKRLKSYCLKFASGEAPECAAAGDDWDLKFTAINRVKDGVLERQWLLFTANGAVGPLDVADSPQWTSGQAAP